MYPLEPAAVRETMRSLCGEEGYHKFVAELNSRCAKQRLSYWQEVMWEKVEEKLGVRIRDYSTISSFFRHCHVHGVELQHGLTPILYGTRQLTRQYIEAQESLFPNANDVVFGPCWQEAQSEREVLFCEACRHAKKAWSPKRGA